MPRSTPRLASIEFARLVPGANQAVNALANAAAAGDLEEELLELINLRASQINGCAYCVQYHSSNLRQRGVSLDKIALVAAWEESGIFSAREEAAFAWTEALTLIAATHVPDAAYAAARDVFSEQDLAALTVAISAINVWNRFAVSFRYPPDMES